MIEKLNIRILSRASDYIAQLSDSEQAILAADIETMAQGESGLVYTKQLDGPIRELIMGNHRVTYFCAKQTLYFVEGFRKKSTKTPKGKIDFAKNIYKKVKSQKQ
ncbi:MAG: type II toxin-antitoxin system RelE/ParE family toxin [bacterium]|nr:type II toxin-antitoxin system RelE/ParE family toxin [bacterium]